MLIKGAEIFYEGKFQKLDMLIEGDTIVKIEKNLSNEKETIKRDGKIIIPGLIDIHTHGCLGGDFSYSNDEMINRMTRFYSANGVTSIAATIVAVTRDKCKKAVTSINRIMQNGTDGSRILGIHLEGPFLGDKKKGAQDLRCLEPPDIDYFDELIALSEGNILIVCIDPDYANALTFIRKYSEETTVSLAHTAADYDTAYAAFEAGADNVAHLFNGMNSIHHRNPGLVAAFCDLAGRSDRYVTAEIIADGVHIHPAVIRMMFRLCGENIVLVSDSTGGTGLSAGEFFIGDIEVLVKDKKSVLPDGTVAGSTATLYECMVNAVHFEVPLEKAILSVTEIPAKILGMNDILGSLKQGYQGDFLILSPNLELEEVYIKGNKIT